MNKSEIEHIPIAEIRVVNPRTRNKTKFQEIVASIAEVGLKKPITVSRRELDSDGTRYDLVCGQGRMEACRALGETTIPAVLSDASREERLLMSLVENIARRHPLIVSSSGKFGTCGIGAIKPMKSPENSGLTAAIFTALFVSLSTARRDWPTRSRLVVCRSVLRSGSQWAMTAKYNRLFPKLTKRVISGEKGCELLGALLLSE